jgi:hypothetical protein
MEDRGKNISDGEDKEEDVSNYWMIIRELEGTVN